MDPIVKELKRIEARIRRARAALDNATAEQAEALARRNNAIALADGPHTEVAEHFGVSEATVRYIRGKQGKS